MSKLKTKAPRTYAKFLHLQTCQSAVIAEFDETGAVLTIKDCSRSAQIEFEGLHWCGKPKKEGLIKLRVLQKALQKLEEHLTTGMEYNGTILAKKHKEWKKKNKDRNFL